MKLKLPAAALALALAAPAFAAPADDARVAALEAQVAQLTQKAQSERDRSQVENLFSRYMALHNAFRDPEIVGLWAKKGTPDVRAQYSNNGVYTDWDKIMSYHAQRPGQQAGVPLCHHAGDRGGRRWTDRQGPVDRQRA